MTNPKPSIPFTAKVTCALIWALSCGGLFFALVSFTPASAQAATSNYKGIWVINQMREFALCTSEATNPACPNNTGASQTTIDAGPASWNVTFCIGPSTADTAGGWDGTGVTGAAITCNASATSRVTETWSVPDTGWTKSYDPYDYFLNIHDTTLPAPGTSYLSDYANFRQNVNPSNYGIEWHRLSHDGISGDMFGRTNVASFNTTASSNTQFAHNITTGAGTGRRDFNNGIVLWPGVYTKTAFLARSGSYGITYSYNNYSWSYSQMPVVWRVSGTVCTPASPCP